LRRDLKEEERLREERRAWLGLMHVSWSLL
jgi:hypothetical protein